ncbi:MAG TPA: DUF4838 domain-containing protein [Phycisphaerae bacterium]|nr:DUF4838 domain-containing protein [Phycisphaerae bacterium]HRR84266.1 DUF4838 domain-containing protein [Phycisphaerae bacterium]
MRSLPVTLALLGFAAPAAPATTFIVVNRGEYKSAEQAGNDEANVKWDDGDDADDVICTENFAALELQRYLRMMAGPEGQEDYRIVDDDHLPAKGEIILLGNPQTNKAVKLPPADFGDLGPEGYIIRSAERSTHIGGERRIGTLYGVYRFLDHLGVRWLSPGKIGEEIPDRRLRSLDRSLNIKEKPAFVSRGFHAWEDRGDPEFFDWMARNRMNYWCVQVPDKAALKKRGIQMNCGGHLLTHRFISPDAAYPYNHSGFAGDDDRPADPYPVSPDFKGDADEDGKLSYSEAHPEWYGFIGGKRSFRIRDDFGDNFCTSNHHACDEFFKNLVKDLIDGEWKDADSINFWTLDAGKWCQCDSCKTLGTPTDRNLLLVHRLRQETERATQENRLHRNIRIYFLAYSDVIEPPTRPLPDDFDYENCIATFFPIRRCYVHRFDDPACTEFNRSYMNHFINWFVNPDRHYRGQIFIGEYYNVSRYKCLPIVFERTMSVDIPYYFEQGARHMHYMHCTTRDWGTRTLTNWQFARMLWDPKLDSKALLDDYFAHRYGPAAGKLRELYGILDTALCNATPLKYHLVDRLNRDNKELFPTRHLKHEAARFDADDGPDLVEMVASIDKCVKLMEEVQSQQWPERVRSRIMEDAGPIRYAADTLHFFDALVRARRLVQAGRRDKAKTLLPEMKRLAKALEADTTSMKWSSSHASAANGLEASLVRKAYEQMVSELTEDPR